MTMPAPPPRHGATRGAGGATGGVSAFGTGSTTGTIPAVGTVSTVSTVGTVSAVSAFSAFSAFSAGWLQLREPHDHVARAAAAAAIGEGWIAALHGNRRGPGLQVLDLGCGTGATLRQLAPRLGGVQHWRAFDHDEALLAAWPAAMRCWARHEGHRVIEQGDRLRIEGDRFAASVTRHRVDLARGLAALPLADADLLAATALLDLVSSAWLAELIERAARGPAVLCLGLVVDGRIEWTPALDREGGGAEEAQVAAAFAAHQGRDKGFGPALGAHAPAVARGLLEQAGYAVTEGRSDWVLQGSGAGAALQAALIEGIARAALEQAPGQAASIERWRRLRAAAVERTCLRVGHVDLVAVPGRRRT
jgi:SAM-dependent methyltransferase